MLCKGSGLVRSPIFFFNQLSEESMFIDCERKELSSLQVSMLKVRGAIPSMLVVFSVGKL